MVWNPERYRDKRQRVLDGNGRKGSGLVKVLLGSLLGVLVVGFVVAAPSVWESISFRHLDDAILRVDRATHVATLLPAGQGVRLVAEDQDGRRLVVTFDRRETSAARIVERLQALGVECFLLNTLPRSLSVREREEVARESI